MCARSPPLLRPPPTSADGLARGLVCTDFAAWQGVFHAFCCLESAAAGLISALGGVRPCPLALKRPSGRGAARLGRTPLGALAACASASRARRRRSPAGHVPAMPSSGVWRLASGRRGGAAPAGHLARHIYIRTCGYTRTCGFMRLLRGGARPRRGLRLQGGATMGGSRPRGATGADRRSSKDASAEASRSAAASAWALGRTLRDGRAEPSAPAPDAALRVHESSATRASPRHRAKAALRAAGLAAERLGGGGPTRPSGAPTPRAEATAPYTARVLDEAAEQARRCGRRWRSWSAARRRFEVAMRSPTCRRRGRGSRTAV